MLTIDSLTSKLSIVYLTVFWHALRCNDDVAHAMTYVREEQNSHAPHSRRSVPRCPTMTRESRITRTEIKVQLKTSWWSLMSQNWCPWSVWLVGKTYLICVCSRLVLTSQARTSCTPPWTLTATWRTPQVRAFFVQLLNRVAITKAIEQLERDATAWDLHHTSL